MPNLALTRRKFIATVSSLAAAVGSARVRAEPVSAATLAFEVPRGACDSHIHIIGDPVEFPMSSGRDYTPPPATAGDYLQVLKRLACDRAVIVTPTVYGTTNAATLAAISLLGPKRARGVGLFSTLAPPETLRALSEGGITGMRLLISGDRHFNLGAAVKRLEANMALAVRWRWHVEISTPPDVIAALARQLAASPVPLVLDYFAWAQGGADQPGFDAVLSLVEAGHVYVKLAEPYRLSKGAPDYPDLEPVVRALVKANPDRLLWGSGWPHVDSSAPAGRGRTVIAPNLPVDTVHLLNLLAVWVPDPQTRYKILVANPARLYGFPA